MRLDVNQDRLSDRYPHGPRLWPLTNHVAAPRAGSERQGAAHLGHREGRGQRLGAEAACRPKPRARSQ